MIFEMFYIIIDNILSRCHERHSRSTRCKMKARKLIDNPPKLCFVSCSRTNPLDFVDCEFCRLSSSNQFCDLHKDVEPTLLPTDLIKGVNNLLLLKEGPTSGKFQPIEIFAYAEENYKELATEPILNNYPPFGGNQCSDKVNPIRGRSIPKAYGLNIVNQFDAKEPLEILVKKSLTDDSFKNVTFICDGSDFLHLVFLTFLKLGLEANCVREENEFYCIYSPWNGSKFVNIQNYAFGYEDIFDENHFFPESYNRRMFYGMVDIVAPKAEDFITPLDSEKVRKKKEQFAEKLSSPWNFHHQMHLTLMDKCKRMLFSATKVMELCTESQEFFKELIDPTKPIVSVFTNITLAGHYYQIFGNYILPRYPLHAIIESNGVPTFNCRYT